MRYVDLAALRVPPAWAVKAANATEAVRTGANPNDYADVWRDIKDALTDLLPGKKCWFCESVCDRSDNAVDHFRPKNRVSDAASTHNGYRWLAFDPMNFRYACTFCNSRRVDVLNATSGGKADRFPLIDETRRVYSEAPLGGEQPALLDPCSTRDWRLLGCMRENGEPCSTSESAVDEARVAVSIDVYHLQYEPTCKRRHRAAIGLIADVAQGKRHFLNVVSGEESEADFEASARKIARAIDKGAEFSGEMRFILKGERHSEHPWIQDLLEA